MRSRSFVIACLLCNYVVEIPARSDYVTEDETNVCTTRGCVRAAAVILENMDTSVDPCDDFYQFACGGYVTRHISDGISFPPKIIEENLVQKLIDALFHPLPTDQEDTKIVQDFYSSCVNADFREEMGRMVEYVRNIRPWPLLDDDEFDEYAFDWLRWNDRPINEFTDTGEFLKAPVQSNGKDNDVPPVIEIYIPDFGEHRIDDPTGELTRDTLRNLGIFVSDYGLEDLKNAFEFGSLLITATECEFEDDPRQTTVAGLYDISSDIDWLQFLNDIYAPADIKIELDQPINVTDCTIHVLPKIISLIDWTPRRTVATYVLLRLINIYTSYFTHFQLEKKVCSLRDENDRFKFCASLSIGMLPIQTLRLFENRYLKQSSKKHIIEITRRINDAFRPFVQYSTWIDERTKQILMKKFDERTFRFFINDTIYETITELVTKNLRVKKRGFFDNVFNIWPATSVLNLLRLRRPDLYIHYHRYGLIARQVAAYFLDNEIGASMVMQRFLFFDEEVPMSLRYGAAGYIVGHEILHGVNTYVLEREYFPTMTFDDEFVRRYDDKVDCFVKKFNNASMKEFDYTANGETSLAENLSDLEGMRAAYFAYQKFRRNREGKRLPGLGLTSSQLFWIAGANLFCYTENKFLFHSLLDDVHSHNKIRVLAMTSNSPEFSRDFQCSSNSPMNSKDKCFLWLPKKLY